MQLIAAVYGRPQKSVLRIASQGNRVAKSGRKPASIARSLLDAIRVELPNPGARVELGAWVISRRIRLAIPSLAGVGRRADVYVKVAALHHEVVGMVGAGHRQPRYNRVGISRGGQRA